MMILNTVMYIRTPRKTLAKSAMTELCNLLDKIPAYQLYLLSFVIHTYQLRNVEYVLMDMKLPILINVKKFQKISFVFKNPTINASNVFPTIS